MPQRCSEDKCLSLCWWTRLILPSLWKLKGCIPSAKVLFWLNNAPVRNNGDSCAWWDETHKTCWRAYGNEIFSLSVLRHSSTHSWRDDTELGQISSVWELTQPEWVSECVCRQFVINFNNPESRSFAPPHTIHSPVHCLRTQRRAG